MLEELGRAFARAFSVVEPRPYGTDRAAHQGFSDNAPGVQWNTGIDRTRGVWTLGVNLEGMAYDGWPIGRFLERERATPELPRLARDLDRADSIEVWLEREAWQVSARPPILESSLGPTPPVMLDRLDDEVWIDMVGKALECLEPNGESWRRARQSVTLVRKGAVEKDVSPHLQFKAVLHVPAVPTVSAWELELDRVRALLKPVHDFVSRRSQHGQVSNTFRLLTDDGRELDATFSLVEEGGQTALYVESRGPSRNPNYNAALEVVLQRLATSDAVVVSSEVDSTTTASLSAEERRVEIDGYEYPIALRTLPDILQFRRSFGAAQARVGRKEGARGGGNPTKRVRLLLGFPEGKSVTVDALRGWVGPGSTAPNYWALCADPDRYRIGAALRDLEVDLWTTGGKAMRPGDKVAIWQAKGSGSRRGVVGLGVVESVPRPQADTGNPYWVDPADASSVAERVTIRYLRDSVLPLWMGEPGNEFLDDLSVARARGGTVFHLGGDDWTRIVSRQKFWSELSTESVRLIEAVRGRTGGQGYAQDPRLRRAVEDAAMSRAQAYYQGLGWTVVDVSKRASFDLLCERNGQVLRVEVKGTTGHGNSILVTANEVNHARAMHPQTALFMVADLSVDISQDPPVVSGGTEIRFEPWEIREGALRPLAFELNLSAS